VLEAGLDCLFGPKGKRERKERKAGIPEGVVVEGGEGDRATERLRLLLEKLLVDDRPLDGIADGKPFRLDGWLVEGVFGERRVVML
jgi:hypothetical protein